MACKHPQKIAYPTREAAKAAMNSLYRAGRGNPDLTIYGCGKHFHIGHNVVRFRRRIRRALNRGNRP